MFTEIVFGREVWVLLRIFVQSGRQDQICGILFLGHCGSVWLKLLYRLFPVGLENTMKIGKI